MKSSLTTGPHRQIKRRSAQTHSFAANHLKLSVVYGSGAHSQIVGGLSRGENGHLLHFSSHKGGQHTICSAKNARPGHFSLEKALPTIWECALEVLRQAIFHAISLLTGALDAAFRQKLEQSEHYKDIKEDLEEDAEYVGTVGKVAAFIGIGSIALVILGIGYCAARREGTGGAMICGAVPLTILSYSCYQASENFRTQVAEDPVKLMILTTVNKPKY